MKKYVKLFAAVLATTLLLAGCSKDTNSAEGSFASGELYELSFDEIDFLDLMGASKREIAEKFLISDYENKDELSVDMTYNGGEFAVNADFEFVDSQLNDINFGFNVKELSEDDLIYLYNSIYKSLTKYYGEIDEHSDTLTDEGLPYKTVLRNWVEDDYTIFLSRHYWNDGSSPYTLSLRYSGPAESSESTSYFSSSVHYIPSPSCDAASSNWGDDYEKVMLLNPNFSVRLAVTSTAMCELTDPVEGFNTDVQLGFSESNTLCTLTYLIDSADKSDPNRVIDLYNGIVSMLNTTYGIDGTADYEDGSDLSLPGEYSVLWKTDRSIVAAVLKNDENEGISIMLDYGAADEKYYK